jgi:triosephosphate isomerase
VSASQVSSMGVKYAIIGHSERRQLFNETDTVVNKKVLLGIKNKLNIILCIGETKEEKDMLKTDRILKRQLINALRDVDNKDIKNIIIAYEPIWSIGTGNVPENKEISTITSYIKGIVNNLYHEDIDIPVLYGGSVNEKNIEELNKINEISGVLVGGASLKADKLKKIKEVIIGE